MKPLNKLVDEEDAFFSGMPVRFIQQTDTGVIVETRTDTLESLFILAGAGRRTCYYLTWIFLVSKTWAGFHKLKKFIRYVFSNPTTSSQPENIGISELITKHADQIKTSKNTSD